MTFDAGSIEAKLKLDRSDFQRGLEEAKAEGADFENKDYTAKLDVDTGKADAEITSTEALYEALRENLSRTIDVDVEAHTAAADAELEATTALADRLDRKDVNVNVGGMSGLLGMVSQLGGAFGAMGDNISEGKTVATGLFSTIIGVAPLAVAAIVPLIGLAGALTSAISGAVASIGAVGIIAVPLITKMIGDYQKLSAARQQYAQATNATQRQAALQAEAKATDNLSGSEKGLFGMLQQVMAIYHRLQSEFAKPLASALKPWFDTVKSVLGLLPLLIGPALGTIKTLGEVIDSIVKSPSFRAFIRQLGEFGAFALKQFGLAGIAIAHAFANIIVAFMPLARVILPGIVNLARAFAQWTESLAGSKGFHQFIDYVIQNGPLLGSLLFSLLTIFVKLVIALMPLGHVLLIVTAVVAKFLSILTPNELIAVIGALSLLAVVLAAVFAGVPLLIAAVVAAIVAFFALIVNFWPQIHRAWSDAINGIKRDVIDKIVSFFEKSVPNAFDHFINFWKRGWHDFQQWAWDAWHWVDIHVVQLIIRFFTRDIPNAFRTSINWIRDHFWAPFKQHAADAWNWVHDHIVSPIEHAFTVTLPNAFKTGVDIIKGAWSKLQDIVRAPAAWVVDHVVNGLINAYDWVASHVGAPQIPKDYHPMGLQAGGRIPGYGGGDRHMALLEGGEAVVSKETSAEHAATLSSWGVPGFQHGGKVGQNPIGAAQARTGIDPASFHGTTVTAFNKIADIGKILAALATGNERAGENAIYDLFPHGAGGAIGDFAKMMLAIPAHLLTDVVHKLMQFGGGGLGGKGAEIARWAMKWAGKVPYVWGGTAVPGGADCSGFVTAVYEHFGITPPRTSEAQGAWVKRGRPEIGGLAFYNSPAGGPPPGHVAIVGFNGNVISQGGGLGPQITGLHSMDFMFAGVPPGGGGLGNVGPGDLAGAERLWMGAGGGGGNAAHIAGAIAMAESGGRSVKQQGQPPGLTGWGIWQITPTSGINQNGMFGNLLNAANNARAAVYLYHQAGNSFAPWATYTSGAYQRFMDQGGTLPPGTWSVTNNTGQSEQVLTPEERAAFIQLARGSGDGGVVSRLERLIRVMERNASETGGAVADALNGITRGAAYRAAYSTRG